MDLDFKSASSKPTINISDLSSYFAELKGLCDDGIVLFRGHSDINYDLIPSVGRKKEDGSSNIYTAEDEQQMFLEFKRNYALYADSKPSSDLDILFLAQHFGIPTRLLDWSYNPLISLYFACQGNDSHGCVYTIKIPKEHTSIKEGHKFDSVFFNSDKYENEHLFIIPDYTNRRFLNQKGMFMMFKNPFVPISKKELPPTFEVENKKEILKELSMVGITDSMVMPTLDNLGTEIANKYKK